MKLSLEYIAGFFDGEGSVGVYQWRMKGKAPHWKIMVSVTNTNPHILMCLQERFGGTIQSRKPKAYSDKTRNSARWRVRHDWIVFSSKAAFFLWSIYPYLVMKKDQVAVAIQLLSARERRRADGELRENARTKESELALKIKRMKKVEYTSCESPDENLN